VYETEDYRSDSLIVTAFKKLSTANAKKGKVRSSYVSSFPFSGHSRIIDGEEVMPLIEDKLPNQEPLLKTVDQAAKEEQDEEMAENPFVFLMTQAKMASYKEAPAPS